MKREPKDKRKVIKAQILTIRDSGLTNMLDTVTVQRLADERKLFALARYIEKQPNQYVKFIISGDENLLPE